MLLAMRRYMDSMQKTVSSKGTRLEVATNSVVERQQDISHDRSPVEIKFSTFDDAKDDDRN